MEALATVSTGALAFSSRRLSFMKHISIVATKPGCGKTFVLTNLFNKSNLPNKVILAPTNKAKQEIIKRLTSEDASRVFTMDKFKQNYIELQHKEGSKLYKDYY